MTNVVKFGKPSDDPLVWVCQCGCSTFRLYSTGAMECASCVKTSDGGEWVKELPEPIAEPRESMPQTKVITLNGTPKQALQQMMRNVDPDSLVALIAIEESSRVRTWGGVDTVDRKEWLERRFDDARDLLTMLIPKG